MALTVPFLSICIPTFNRADTLARTLQSITADPWFGRGHEVEIVVSDNQSTDHTFSVVQSFAERFPGLVRYERGPAIAADRNFERALRLGRGEFRKLQNDSFGVRPGLLEPWVRILKSLQAGKPVVFMVNEPPASDADMITHCHDLDGFLKAVSFNSTWIGGFGIWADDLESLTDFSRCADQQLVQTDVVLRMMAAKCQAVVIREFIQPCFARHRKGGYNIAEVFGANYLAILRSHVERGELSHAAYALEKRLVLLEHILPFVVNPEHDFKHDNLLHHLRDYQGEPYFMPALESALAVLKGRGGAISPKARPAAALPPEPFEKQWRRANPHNETTCPHPVPLSKVSVGRRSYGTINAWHWGHPDEHLRIGHFCSIGAGVEFLLGGNHAMDGLSTFPFKVKFFGQTREALTKGPIVVGDDVWIGNRATILSGSRIGQGAVIGACAVVSGEVPPYAVVTGNPARVVRYRFTPAVIKALLQLDYSRVRDQDLASLQERLYEPLHEGNVEAMVRFLMGESQVLHPSASEPVAVSESEPGLSDRDSLATLEGTASWS